MDAAPVAAPPTGRRRYDPAWSDWSTPRRWPGVLLTTAVVLLFFGVLIWHFQPKATPQKATWHPVTLDVKPSFVPGTAGHELLTTFKGTGDRTGLAFHSFGQLLVLHAGCQCEFNFVVEFESSIDQPISIPVNVVGHYNEVLNVSMPAGAYSMSVIGTGPWIVQLIQPEPSATTLHAPFTYFSDGDDVVGPFSSADTYLKLKFLSGTNGSLFVHVLDAAGLRIATPFVGHFAVVGNYNLAKVKALPNPYYLEIDAAGYWAISVQRSGGS